MSRLILPINDVAQRVANAGFTGWQVVTGTAVIWAETAGTFDAYCINVVGQELREDGTPNPAYRSLDVGLFAVNTFWHPNHSIADLLDPDENCRIAHDIFTDAFHDAAGTWAQRTVTAWSFWVTYRKGLHKPFEGPAVRAAREIGVAV